MLSMSFEKSYLESSGYSFQGCNHFFWFWRTGKKIIYFLSGRNMVCQKVCVKTFSPYPFLKKSHDIDLRYCPVPCRQYSEARAALLSRVPFGSFRSALTVRFSLVLTQQSGDGGRVGICTCARNYGLYKFDYSFENYFFSPVETFHIRYSEITARESLQHVVLNNFVILARFKKNSPDTFTLS
jgi:hypothetical protein